MDRPNSFLTTPVAILLSSFVISIAILMHGGVIKLGGSIKPPTAPATQAQPGQGAQPTPPAKVNVSVGHLSVKGNDKAKVTIVEFGDFQCPFCEKFFKDTEPQIIKDYVDLGKAKFAFRQYAFLGQESTWAAEASECANEQGKFWEYHDYLYSHQGAENSGAFSKDKLEGFAQSLGLNADQFKTCLESEKYAQKVKDDLVDGQKAGVNGTPATFVNGQLVSGAQPYANFKSIIDAELSK